MTREEAIRCFWYFSNVAGGGKNVVALTRRDKEAFDMAIKSLSAEPCEDAISRQAVLDLIYNSWKHNGVGENYGELSIDALKALPPVTPKQKMGKWIECMPSGAEEWCYKCSECNFWKYKKTINLSKFKYCPNCGAKMESEDSE